MNVTYQQLGKIITAQQASISKEYDKTYWLPNGNLKKVESFITGEIQRIDYYLDDNETEEQAVDVLMPYNCGFTILSREMYGSYSINDGNTYYEGINIGRYKTLLDQNNKLICYQEIDITTNEPILEDTRKYIGTYEDEKDEYYCRFHYNPDGSLYNCEFNYMSDYDSEEFYQNNIELISGKFILSDEMYDYYLTSEFLAPLL